MKGMKTVLVLLVPVLFLLLGMLPACYYDNEEELYGGCDTAGVSYAGFIRPLLDNKCTPSCHSGAQPTGNLDFTQYAVVRTAAIDGRLYAAVTRSVDWMPQNGPRLDNCTLSMIDAWIKAGALNN